MPRPIHFEIQAADPKRVGWLAYATDTEGNIFGMLQPDAAAK